MQGQFDGDDRREKIRRSTAAAAAIAAFALLGSAQANAAPGCGHASWYALTSKTASGERMNPAKLTAAHRSLPFGTKVLVTNKRNGKSVVVRINDRGPFIRGRVIDVSKAAAANIGMVRSGTAQVCYQIITADSQKVAGKGLKDG
ncbi:septal ring lytic transglycosylase RlpA family protein [Aliirhizobium terrae]|uniref:septal ring lytic transglycosylase RlpA family protein n=1 Tax=Terrirhizobium terrae TaxID=2926709 RepID=UPI0035B547F2